MIENIFKARVLKNIKQQSIDLGRLRSPSYKKKILFFIIANLIHCFMFKSFFLLSFPFVIAAEGHPGAVLREDGPRGTRNMRK